MHCWVDKLNSCANSLVSKKLWLYDCWRRSAWTFNSFQHVVWVFTTKSCSIDAIHFKTYSASAQVNKWTTKTGQNINNTNPCHPCMVYLPTFTTKKTPNVGKYTSPMDGIGSARHFDLQKATISVELGWGLSFLLVENITTKLMTRVGILGLEGAQETIVSISTS